MDKKSTSRNLSIFGLPDRIGPRFALPIIRFSQSHFASAHVLGNSLFHQRFSSNLQIKKPKTGFLLACPIGFEPTSSRVGVLRAIQLCHGQKFKDLQKASLYMNLTKFFKYSSLKYFFTFSNDSQKSPLSILFSIPSNICQRRFERIDFSIQ